ncbi:hypothetical protein [Sinorhizobium fredii]|uniref:hypothetical protein n=1 Tax=Rhizobium fredii TaxID=380 RepID=UPI003393D396
MATTDATAIAVEVYRTFPKSLREGLLETRSFRRLYGLITTATLSLGDINFSRNELFDAFRRLYESKSYEPQVTARDGSIWIASLRTIDSRRRLVLTCGSRRSLLPDFWYLEPSKQERLAAFELETRANNVSGPAIEEWRTILTEGPLKNDDVELFQKEFRLVPSQVSSLIASGVAAGEVPSETLVPPQQRYYQRLIGSLSTEASLGDFLERGAEQHIRMLVQWEPARGLQQALLMSSHPHVSRYIGVENIDSASLISLFRWLADDGDRISQVGGFELGMSLLTDYPEIQDSLVAIARQIKDDDQGPDGRLQLLSNLVVFVEGGVAQRGFLKGSPPFWRRMATIAQASLIERELVNAAANFADVSNWMRRGQGQAFYLQTLVDCRQEPRWLPDFISPEQLKHEFVGRLVSSARNNVAAITSPELRELLLGDSSDSLSSQMDSLLACFPGPLEGAVEAQIEPPDELTASMAAQLETASHDPRSFASLVNTCLVFKVSPAMASLAAAAIREAKYSLQSDRGTNQVFALLGGLATVAAVTRTGSLAQELRILARVQRRRSNGANFP